MAKKSRNNTNDTLAVDTVEYGEKLNLGWVSKLKVLPLGIVAFAILLSAIVMYVNYATTLDNNLQKISHINELLQLSERIEKNTLLIKNADSKAFIDLEISKNKVEKLLNVLKNGGKIEEINKNITPIEAEHQKSLNDIKTNWEMDKGFIGPLINQKQIFINLKIAMDLTQTNSGLLTNLISDFKKKNAFNEKYKSGSEDLYLVGNRINQGMDSIFSDNFTANKARLLFKDLQYVNSYLNTTINTNITTESGDTIKDLKEIQKAFIPYVDLTDKLANSISYLETAKVSFQKIHEHTTEISHIAENLNKDFINKTAELSYNRWISIILFIVSLAGFGLLAMVFYERSLQALRFAKVLEKNQANEIAIKVLISQMEPLDEGDFTNKVFVDDKFIAQIAQKVDNTREIFESIVRKIKSTSKIIQSAADTTLTSTKKLTEVSDQQYKKIGDSITYINNITASMDEVAQSTWIAETDSNQSKEASQIGGKLVQESISKMAHIRVTIQESSKKIKKSSESAQAITEVTGLIKNITKQIEVLALNAAIQAASAGEAGRGFTVVAEEVQRLAVDSKLATNNILELVKEVQEDIGSAVDSMERTTQEVVEQEQINQKAGSALKTIEDLSEKVSKGVMEASAKLNEKSSEMASISIEMKSLQEISHEAKSIIQKTTEDVSKLNNMSKDLESSVHGYRVKE